MAALDYSKFDRIVDSDEETGDRDEAQVAAALAGKVARDRLDETRRTAWLLESATYTSPDGPTATADGL